MVRKLKFHEQKLLRKVNFVNWEVSNNLHEVKIMRRYCIQKREDYTLYNKLSREIRYILKMNCFFFVVIFFSLQRNCEKDQGLGPRFPSQVCIQFGF